MFEPRETNTYKVNLSNENRSTTSMYQIAPKSGQQLKIIGGGAASASTPTLEQLKPHTDRLTRCIQELWNEMQITTENKETIVPYSEKIVEAVNELTAQFPTVSNIFVYNQIFSVFTIFIHIHTLKVIQNESIKNALRSLQIGSKSMRTECIGMQNAAKDNDTDTFMKYMQDIRNSAYNLAMATKILVTQFS